jgi:hypothetical protein
MLNARHRVRERMPAIYQWRELDVGPLLGMPAEKPAGRVPGVREEAVHARLLHCWIKNKLALSVLMQHRVVVLDAHAAKGLPIRGHAISKYAIVPGIRDSQQAQRRHKRPHSG